MSLTALKATQKTAAITEAFVAIGATGETKMPRSGSNTEPVAWEFYIATSLARLAEARKKKAHAACVAQGLIPDHEKEPLEVGPSAVIYQGEAVQIAVTVSNPAKRVDVAALLATLREAGVSRRLLDNALVLATGASKAPHQFTAALVTA